MFEWKIRVYIEDTDFGGIVYYANYLKFMERTRTEWLRSLGLSQAALQLEDVLFVVTEAAVKYRKSACLDDELLITVDATPKGKASMDIFQRVFRLSDNEPELLAEGTVIVTTIKASSNRPCRLPDVIKEQLIAS